MRRGICDILCNGNVLLRIKNQKIFPNLEGLIAILIEQHRGSFWLTFRTKGGKCRVTRYVIENLFSPYVCKYLTMGKFIFL